jgi:hypothetical protein
LPFKCNLHRYIEARSDLSAAVDAKVKEAEKTAKLIKAMAAAKFAAAHKHASHKAEKQKLIEDVAAAEGDAAAASEMAAAGKAAAAAAKLQADAANAEVGGLYTLSPAYPDSCLPCRCNSSHATHLSFQAPGFNP